MPDSNITYGDKSGQSGYVKLYRATFSQFVGDYKTWAFWCWCLKQATYTDHVQDIGASKVSLRPGQLVFGRESASRELGMSEREIRTCLDKLLATSKLTSRTTSKYSVLTIVNYDVYSGAIQPSDQHNDHQNDHKQEVIKKDTYKHARVSGWKRPAVASVEPYYQKPMPTDEVMDAYERDKAYRADPRVRCLDCGTVHRGYSFRFCSKCEGTRYERAYADDEASVAQEASAAHGSDVAYATH